MSAPTPGPWTLGEWDRNIFVYGGPNNDDIAEFNFADEHTVTITREEAIANARLFLGAPDLLAAVRFVLDHIADPERGPRDLYPAFGLDSAHAIEMCRDAIAKANGDAK